MIKVRNLNKYYYKGKPNELHVINDTSLELPSNGLISLVGKSGSGKTTLLNVIGGLDKAKGIIEYEDVTINNYNMNKIDKYRKDNIGYIFQSYNLLPNETVYNNLKIALELVDITDPKEIDKRIEYTLKRVGMYKYRKKQTFALSGGQQQRISIARALAKGSKIIIADEPTGNLDSENTLEVMNILKKISKNTLVLLVTHDMSIAKFYSDRIIEVKDGKVERDYSNEKSDSLSFSSMNKIYLKDYNLNESKTDFGSVKVYSEEENFKIDLEVIVRNGNIYIQANKQLKLVETSNLEIINDHYRDLSSTDYELNDYDNSWFVKTKRSLKDKLNGVLAGVKESIHSFLHSSKKIKFINTSFLLMGIILGLAAVCLINFTTRDTSDFVYAENYNIITSSDHTFFHDPIETLVDNYKNGKIDNISLSREDSVLTFKHHYTFNKNISIKSELMVLRYIDNVEKSIVYGEAPKADNEAVIDIVTAESILSHYGNKAKYEDLIGKVVTLYDNVYLEIKIVGITNNSKRVAYISDTFYTKWACPVAGGLFGNRRYYKNELDANGNPLYEIIEGNALEELDITLNRQALVHDEFEGEFKFINGEEYINLSSGLYKVVGFYRYKDNTFNVGPNEVITNVPNANILNASLGMCLNDDEFVLIKGEKPDSVDECMVSAYTGVSLGDTYYGRKVVGIYTGTERALSTLYVVDTPTYLLENNKYSDLCFTVNSDLELTNNEEVISMLDYDLKIDDETEESNVKLFELLSYILVGISILFLYLLLRSRMFSRIYDIGVYRSLGATKSKIRAIFTIDLLVTTTLTSFVGYIGILALYNFTANSINDMLGEMMFQKNNLIVVMGIPFIYVINYIISMILLSNLLKKTPSEICTKYDI